MPGMANWKTCPDLFSSMKWILLGIPEYAGLMSAGSLPSRDE
jgi:hypothetical protein